VKVAKTHHEMFLFHYDYLLKTVITSLPRAPDPPSSFFARVAKEFVSICGAVGAL
jgi:hypothetical protein